MKKLIIICFILMTGINRVNAGDIVVTTTGGVDEIIGNAIALTGAATGAPEANAASNSAANTITTNITTFTNNAWLIDIVGSRLNGSFTPDASQTEQSDQQTGASGGAANRRQGTAASSTKLITPATNPGTTPMIQTHSSGAGNNNLVHAVAAVAPTTTIAIESTSNGFTTTNNNNTFTWTHNFNDDYVDNKLLVGVVTEDRVPNAQCTTGAIAAGESTVVSSITHNGNNMTRVAFQTRQIGGGANVTCLRAELWYIDIDAPPTPLAEWRMDEGSWSGTAGEVADVTGNGYDGTARNGAVTDNTTPAINTDPGTCGYGVFDDAGGGTGDYIELPGFPDQTTDFTITAWIRTNDNTRAGQRVFADDENNTGGYALSVGDPGAGRLRFYSRGAALEIIDTPTGGAIANNTWYFVAGVADITGSQITTYIYDTSGALVDSATGAITGAWTTDAGVASIAGETNSGETGNRFFGNVDEVHFYTDVLSVSELAAVRNETHPCPAVGDITVNFSANINSIMAGSVSLTNASLGDPESSNGSTNTTGTTIGPTALTSTLNAWLIDGVVSETAGSFSFAGQTERWEETIGSAVSAMSTKADVAAGANSMSQTHTVGGTNRKAHVAASVAPFDTSTNIVFDSVASTSGTGNSIVWPHSLTTTNTANTKLLVTIAFEEGGTCNDTINSVTYGNLNLTQVVQAQIAGGGSCKQVEIWYADLTNIIVSTDNNSNLGGQAMDQDEAVEYDVANDSGTLFFDDTTFDSNARLDALHQFENGNVAVSVAGNGEAVGGNAIPNGSIALLTPSGTAGVYSFSSILFNESNFASGDETIDAVYVRDNGNIVLSTANNANLTGIGNFDDDDIVEWNPNTNTATLVFNIASITGAANNWDVDGVHFLNDDSNLILFSLYNDRTIGPTTYENGDVLLYNRNTSTLSIYFSEDNFTGNEDVDALTLAVPPFTGNVINHYDIDFSPAAGITCLPVSVTITAKDDTNATITHSSDTTIDFNVSTNLGIWGTPTSGTGTLTDPTPGTTDNGDAQYEFPSGESSVTIPLNYTVFAVPGNSETFEIDITTTPDEDGGIADASDDPTIDFFLTAIVFNNVTDGNNTITTQISGKPSNTGFDTKIFNLQVLRASDSDTSVCQSIFGLGDVVSIELGAECKNPNTCAGRELNIDNINPALPATGVYIDTSDDDSVVNTVTSYEAVDLEFGAIAAAEIVLNYPDAGQIQLHARYELLLDDGTPSGEYATGISNDFIVRPFGMAITDITAGATSNPGSFSIAANVFTTAGSDFSATVGAYLWQATDDDGNPWGTADDGVPDFRNVFAPGVFEGVDITNNNDLGFGALAPNFASNGTITASRYTPQVSAAGSVNGILNNGAVASGDFSNGEATITDMNYTEVGSILLIANFNDYLGDTSVDILGSSAFNGVAGQSGSTLGTVGRFIPWRFDVSDNTPDFADSCTGFTYLDQNFYYNNAPVLTLTAYAETGNVTMNYGGGISAINGFVRFPTNPTLNRNYVDGHAAPPPPNAALNTMTAGTVTLGDETDYDGEVTITLESGDTGDIFMYQKSIAEDVFNADVDATFLAAGLTDSDGVCYDDAGTPGRCNTMIAPVDTADDFSIIGIGNTELRFGRFNIGTAVGSELLTLTPPLIAEYYDGNGFLTNTDDSCTAINLTDHIRLDNTGTRVAGNSAMTIGGGTTSISTFNNPLSAGDTGTVFSAPGAGNTGFVNIFGNLGCNDVTVACGGSVTFDYLRYDWDNDDGNDDGPYDDEPNGRIDFGLFKGPGTHIYIREPW
jgi:uncharacterized protein DUF6701/concanavalin A-like lectin/glucanase superfamily protein